MVQLTLDYNYHEEGFKEACVEEESDIVVLLASESAKNLEKVLPFLSNSIKEHIFMSLKIFIKTFWERLKTITTGIV